MYFGTVDSIIDQERLLYRSNMLQFLHGSVHVFEVAVLVLANPLHFLCETST